jgi:hypothetical protein
MILNSCYLIPCNYYSDLDNYDKIPELQKLIGNYKLDIDSPASAAPGELILKKDSTLILKNIPIGVLDVFRSDYDTKEKSPTEINGTWKISNYKDQLRLDVNLKFENVDKKLRNFKTDWDLYKKNEKPVILIILGDPDSCEALKFIKKT